MAGDLLKTPKGRTIVLSDGKEYQLSAFSLAVLADLETEFNCDLDELQKKLTERKATGFQKLLWVMLSEHYPDMTRSQAGRLVLFDKVELVITELMEALDELNK